ncbi:MAG: hypothetical protein GXY43_02145 [Clostridiaceae bacterium]|nr:hypothetical protein [Clostridiaceae bacterium]
MNEGINDFFIHRTNKRAESKTGVRAVLTRRIVKMALVAFASAVYAFILYMQKSASDTPRIGLSIVLFISAIIVPIALVLMLMAVWARNRCPRDRIECRAEDGDDSDRE